MVGEGRDLSSCGCAAHLLTLPGQGCHILVSGPWRGQEGFLEEREGAVAHREPVWGGLELWEPVPPNGPAEGPSLQRVIASWGFSLVAR